MDLPLKYKLFWLYICDKCDNAGAWQPNIRLATAQIGESLELAEVLRVFSDRITQLDGGKLFIVKFIPFQYGNLSPNCRAHIPILNNIEKLRVSKGYPKGIHTLVEKETEKDKEKKKGSTEGKHPTLKEAVDFLGSETIGTDFWDYYESNGWRVGRNPMKDWKASARRWKRQNGKHQRHNSESGRGLGTANEGKSAQYAGVGKVRPVPNPQ